MPNSPIPIDVVELFRAGGDRYLGLEARCNQTPFVPVDAADAERQFRMSLIGLVKEQPETVEVEETPYGWRGVARSQETWDGELWSSAIEMHVLNASSVPAAAPGSFLSSPIMVLIARSPRPTLSAVADDFFRSARFTAGAGTPDIPDLAAPGAPISTDYAPDFCSFTVRFPRVPLVTDTSAFSGTRSSMASLPMPEGMLRAECVEGAAATDEASVRAIVGIVVTSSGFRPGSEIAIEATPYGWRARVEIMGEFAGVALGGIMQTDIASGSSLVLTALGGGSGIPETAAFLASAALRDAPRVAGDGASTPTPGEAGWHRTALPGGMTIELPYGVITGHGDQKFPLLVGYEAAFDARIAKGDALAPLTVAALGPAGDVGLLVDLTRSPDYTIGQDELEAWSTSPTATAGVDALFRRLWDDRSDGDVMVEWQGTEVVDTRWGLALETRYRWHLAHLEVIQQTRVLRILDGERTFTLTIGYDEAFAEQLVPVAERVAASVRLADD